MRRSRRKTLGQHLVSGATMGLPAPVRAVAGSRWGSRLFLLILAVLFAAGVVTVEWKDGWPTLNFNHQRASEVGKTVVDEWRSIDSLQQRNNPEGRATEQPEQANSSPNRRYPWLR